METVFLIHPKDPEIFAAFPKVMWNKRDFTTYAHSGQHSPACPEYLQECKLASPEQYEGLKNELETIVGYNLKIRKKMPKWI